MGKEGRNIALMIALALAGGATMACKADVIPIPIASPAAPGTIPIPLGARETPRSPVIATATAKNTACTAEADPKVLPPLPTNLTLAGQGPGSYSLEMENSDTAHWVNETTSYMIAAKIWAQMGSPHKFYDSDQINIPNNPGDLLKNIADIAKCGYGTSILEVSDQKLFDVSDPITFKVAQQIAALLKKRSNDSASLPPLPNYYPSGQSNQTYENIDHDLEKLVLAKVEATLKDMRVSNVPALRKYAQVMDRLRQGQNPGNLLFTFGFDKQLYVPDPLKIRMPSFDENYFGQGYIAMVFNNTTLAGGQSDGDFQFADIELRLGSGFLALSKEAAQTVLAKEMAMIESRFGLLKATTRGKK